MFKDGRIHLGMNIHKVRFPVGTQNICFLSRRTWKPSDAEVFPTLGTLPPLTFVQSVSQDLQVNRAMVSPHQLLFTRPAVAPEHICIRRDQIAPGQSEAPVRLQILIPVLRAGTGRNLKDVVPLDEEELGLTGQHGTCICIEEAPDVVQMQTCAVGVRTQEMVARTAADDAADEAVACEVLPPSEYLSENRESVGCTQPFVQDHVEVKSRECLFQRVWVSEERWNNTEVFQDMNVINAITPGLTPKQPKGIPYQIKQHPPQLSFRVLFK